MSGMSCQRGSGLGKISNTLVHWIVLCARSQNVQNLSNTLAIWLVQHTRGKTSKEIQAKFAGPVVGHITNISRREDPSGHQVQPPSGLHSEVGTLDPRLVVDPGDPTSLFLPQSVTICILGPKLRL
ncbi:hypothetical protein HAX54_000828 [Datura stramonium]|uniref:Uncharacterized protein n=1 Tax=Datura stramonium TaxID=4076 RepID=A0ABS8WU42_DATST|nr:hypothetical protein [Datura stramonium]